MLSVVNPTRLGCAVRDVTESLRAAKIEDPAREARRLFAAAGIPSEEILVAPERVLNAVEQATVSEMATQRVAGVPISRIVGRRDFHGRSFELSSATLDPRPDSETLIVAALELLAEAGRLTTPLRILDVGTGTGCLLVTLLAELPQAAGLGTDISSGALATASRNAERHGVGSRARFAKRRSLKGIVETFDLLVCNPPYIRSCDIETLPPEVRCHDPHAALDGGEDGLEVTREIAQDLGRVVPSGWAVFEVGDGQADAVEVLITQAKFMPLKRWRDLGGHVRCVAVKTGIGWDLREKP